MQDAAGGASAQSGSRNDSYRAIVSDLEALIQQVQASIKLIESAIVGESPLGNQEIGANVVVLDDVTPRYVRANSALNACNAGLGIAMHFLQDHRTSRHGADQSAGCDPRPVHLTGRI
ncbi:MAG: hypothetical protein JWP51_261 [Bradyrhizobium sp.]|jgi:hypothetical protein|nr:hypothetical protein [Bradyrhizobium sp.]